LKVGLITAEKGNGGEAVNGGETVKDGEKGKFGGEKEQRLVYVNKVNERIHTESHGFEPND